jgi:hypothetical protein
VIDPYREKIISLLLEQIDRSLKWGLVWVRILLGEGGKFFGPEARVVRSINSAVRGFLLGSFEGSH